MPTEPTRAIPSDAEATAGVQERKQSLRAQVRRARSARDPHERARADAARADHLLSWLRPLEAHRVAAYLSTGSEPSVEQVIAELHAAQMGVLLPVLGRRDDGTPRREPDWAWYEGPGTLREGIWGIPEPAGPALGMAALEEADVVLLPGLAVDVTGYRLGQGGAWYDRALAFADPAAPLVVVLNDEEVVTAVPHEDHDRRVRYVATPGGVRELAL